MPHVSIYLREIRTYVYKRICTTIFIAPNWSNPNISLIYFSLWKKWKEFLHRHRVDLPSSHEEMTSQKEQMTISQTSDLQSEGPAVDVIPNHHSRWRGFSQWSGYRSSKKVGSLLFLLWFLFCSWYAKVKADCVSPNSESSDVRLIT